MVFVTPSSIQRPDVRALCNVLSDFVSNVTFFAGHRPAVTDLFNHKLSGVVAADDLCAVVSLQIDRLIYHVQAKVILPSAKGKLRSVPLQLTP